MITQAFQSREGKVKMRCKRHTIGWVFSILVSIFLFLCLNACSSGRVTHQTYNYGNFSCPSNATIQPKSAFATLSLRSGSQVKLKWQPLPAQLSTEATPSPVRLSAILLGPYPSLHDAQQASHHNDPSTSDLIVASIPPIQTDDWTNKTYTSIMKLPPRVAPGYYVEIERAERTNTAGNAQTAGACILKIVP